VRLASEILAGAGTLAVIAASIAWTIPGVPASGYLGAGALCAALSLAIDGRRA